MRVSAATSDMETTEKHGKATSICRGMNWRKRGENSHGNARI